MGDGVTLHPPILIEDRMRLAVVLSQREVWVLDVATGAGGSVFRAGAEFLGKVSADGQGRLYVASSARVYALTLEGEIRWSFPLKPPVGEFPGVPDVTISPTGLFVPSPEGRLYKLDLSDGRVLWSAKLKFDGNQQVVGLVDTAYMPTLDQGLVALNEQSGEVRWRSPFCLGPRGGVALLGRSRILVGERQTDSVSVGYGLDVCGGNASPLPSWLWGGLEFGDGSVALMAGPPDGDRMHHLASDGTTLGSLTVGTAALRENDLYAIGGDDAACFLECYAGASQQPVARLTAVRFDANPAAAELVVELGESCRTGPAGGALGQDGTLYLARGGTVLAVQTRSPGPALGSWSLAGADNRGSRWHP